MRADHDHLVGVTPARLRDHVPRRVGARTPVDLEARPKAREAVVHSVGECGGGRDRGGHERRLQARDVEPQCDLAAWLALVEEDHAAGAGLLGQLELHGKRAGAALNERDRTVRHPVVVGRLTAARVAVRRRRSGQVQVDRPHGRRDVGRRRAQHRPEVAEELPAADFRDERAPLAAADDAQDRRRPVGEQVEVVVKVLERDPVAGEPRGRGHVKRRPVVALRTGKPVAAREVADQLQGEFVLLDLARADRLTELTGRVVAEARGSRSRRHAHCSQHCQEDDEPATCIHTATPLLRVGAAQAPNGAEESTCATRLA